MFEAEIERPTDLGNDHAALATRSLTMPINILMPALSPTMEKGNLAKWLKKEGDKVKSGDVIAEIETDKATMEVEAVDEGTLAKIVVPEGTQDVAVNEVIAVLAGEGEDVKAAGALGRRLPNPALRPAPAPKPAAAPTAAAPAAAPAAETCRCARTHRPRLPAARQANGHGAHLLLAAGAASGEGCRHRPRPHQGSGPHGRVIARDVEEAKSGKGLKAPAAAAGAAARTCAGACRTSRSARCSSRAATRSSRTTTCARSSRSA